MFKIKPFLNCYVDLTITAANVAISSGCRISEALAGATITRGQIIRGTEASATLAQADDAGTDDILGIALSDVASGQYFAYARFDAYGLINVGATLTKGTVYVLSANAAGAIAPLADIATGEYITQLGIASTTSLLAWKPWITGITAP